MTAIPSGQSFQGYLLLLMAGIAAVGVQALMLSPLMPDIARALAAGPAEVGIASGAYGVGVAVLTAPMPPVYGMSGIIAWLIFTLVLATIASALPARRASRLTVRDTLAYE